jgi:2-(1,2-epoxy-1,2-dihydrophenyl)acetyl-CoA isomerase
VGTNFSLEIRDSVAHLNITRAALGNTIDLSFGRDFAQVTHLLKSSPDVRAVVLRGDGKNFCFGGDLRAMIASGSDVQTYLRELTSDLHTALCNLAEMSAPLIAAVNGTAAGAGLGLVLAADMAIAGRSSRFVAAYTAVGLSPDGGTTFNLPRAVGYKRASEMFLTNRVLDAGTALEWGLINEIVDDDELAAASFKLATQLSAGATGAFSETKRLLRESIGDYKAQLERESLSMAARGKSAEGQEGIAAS